MVYYQIFPDRFAGYKGSYEFVSSPDKFYCGSISGIIEKIPYLNWLGIEGIYLNPVFHAHSTHRYNTYNYYEIDPLLGSELDFINLVNELKKNKIKIILDGVFNHTGDDHPLFLKALSSKKYRDCYFIKKTPLPENLTKENVAEYYECWWNFPKLPKINVLNPFMKKHILGAVKKWSKYIDGWRLDVPNEVAREFWNEFNNIVNGKITIAEIWYDGYKWLDLFDTFMNYDLRRKIIELINTYDYKAFTDFIIDFYKKVGDRKHILFNLLSSHDVERLLTLTKDVDIFLRCYFLIFTLPGAVSIYYGDEVGMEGGKDPDNRRVFPWSKKLWNMKILKTIRLFIELKKNTPLRNAELDIVKADNSGIKFNRGTIEVFFSLDKCVLKYRNKKYVF